MADGGNDGVGSNVDWLSIVKQAASIGAYSDFLMMKWLTTQDTTEREFIQRVAEHVAKYKAIQDQNLAVEIINQLGKAIK